MFSKTYYKAQRNLNRAARRLLDSVWTEKKPASPLMSAALNGNLDSFICKGVVEKLKDQDTVSMADIRKARHEVLGFKSIEGDK